MCAAAVVRMETMISSESSDCDNELSDNEPESLDDRPTGSHTTPGTGSRGANPRQLFDSHRSRAFSDISNTLYAKNKHDDTHVLILEEVKKTNTSLLQFSKRLDAVEGRLKTVEEQQKQQLSYKRSEQYRQFY